MTARDETGAGTVVALAALGVLLVLTVAALELGSAAVAGLGGHWRAGRARVGTGVVFGLSYATDPHTAFVGTLLVAVSVGLLSVLSAARARPAAATRTHRLRT